MVDIEQLRALAERLENATGPDREIDRMIACTLGQQRYTGLDVTRSIDSALALVERLLPGEPWIIGSYSTTAGYCTIGESDIEKEVGMFAATPSLAILRALIAALIAQAEASNG